MADQPDKLTEVDIGPVVTRDQSPIYTIAELDRELRQSEIITNLRQFTYDPIGGAAEIVHPYTIVLTQDCDLLQDFVGRAKGDPPDLNGILIYELDPAQQVLGALAGKDIRRRVKQNRDERYHVFEAVPPNFDLLNAGLPELVLDFKKVFTLSADEIYRQCQIENDGAKRRCRLDMPYREHLQSRAAYYLQRVMLPLPHDIESVAKIAKAITKSAPANGQAD